MNPSRKEDWSQVNFPELSLLRKEYKRNKEVYRFKIDGLVGEYADHVYNNSKHKDNYICSIHMLRLMDTFILNDSENIENIFIDSNELYSFLSQTKFKLKDNEILPFLKNNLKIEKYKLYKIYSKSYDRVIFIDLDLAEGQLDDPVLIITDGRIHFSMSINNEDINGRQKKFSKTKGFEQVFIMFLNLLYYMQAFPENITNTPPEIICDKLNKNNSKTVSMSKDIAEYLHENRDVSPHLRSGHFKYLGSDFYTKKKGQTIFVRSTFVKGQAKTITGEK